MDRIKRLSYEVLDNHKSKFGEDFADNKKVLDQISIIRSKGLKNEIAGYITKYIKNEIREEKAKQAQARASQSEIEAESNIGDSILEDASSVEETQLDDAIAEAVIETPVTEEMPNTTDIPTEDTTDIPTEDTTDIPTEDTTDKP